MKSRYFYTIFILANIFICCSNDKTNANKTASLTKDDTSKFKKITLLSILFKPSQLNACTLKIDRIKDSAILTIDTLPNLISPPFNKLGRFSFTLNQIEINTQIEKFYDTTFLRKIQYDSTKDKWMDGIILKVFYTDGMKKGFVYTGNNFPEELGVNAKKIVLYIKENSTDSVLQKYLKYLAEYF